MLYGAKTCVDNKMERGKIKTAEIKFLKAVER
jgi:hypothetical protein